MPTTTLTSREANQDFSRAKRASRQGPVIITERGKPALVLMQYSDYERLGKPQRSILDALAMPGTDDIELELPDRSKDRLRDIDFG